MLDIRKQVGGPSKSADRTYGTEFGMNVRWDMSSAPTSNQRVAKLGFGAGSRGIAIIAYDPETGRITLADGLANGRSLRAQDEPDNWMLRDYGGRDRVWSMRMIVEHENPSAKKSHRSTMWINQGKKQCWGYSQDAFWLVDLGAADPIGINGAGFLRNVFSGGGAKITQVDGRPAIGIGSVNSLMAIAASLRKGGPLGMKPVKLTGITKEKPRNPSEIQREDVITGTGKGMRAALAFNTNMRGGYYTDGKRAAQLRHIFHMMPNFAGGDTGDVGQDAHRGGGTVAQEMSGGGGDCGVQKWQGAIRADALFDVEGIPSNLAWLPAKQIMGHNPYTGAHFLSDVAQKMPGYYPAEDKTSDQPILPGPRAQAGIWVVIYLGEDGNTPPPCTKTTHLNPSDGTGASTGHVPPARTGPTADLGMWRPPVPLNDNGMTRAVFPSGFLTYTTGRILLPIGDVNLEYDMIVPYTLPSGLAGGTSADFRLFYKVTLSASQDVPTEWVEITKKITAGINPPTANTVQFMHFRIPGINLQSLGGAGGGHVDWWLLRRSDDTATGKEVRIAGLPRFGKVTSGARRIPFRSTI